MEANRSFPAEITSPRAARQFVGSVIGHPDDETTQMALVLTSELVTNAVLHARTSVDVRVELEDGLIRVEVADGDPRLPAPMSHAPDALGGRGLFLVEQLASAWGTDLCNGGKVVWFTLSTDAVALSKVGAR
ncbi:MAG: ATP-binding protein [Acidimicrobiales bacterium]